MSVYYYAWRGGPVVDGVPGSPEFINSYNEAIRSSRPDSRDDLSSLIDKYEDSSAFQNRKAKTKKDYGRLLQIIKHKFGDIPVKLLNDRRVRGDFLEWRDEIAMASPRQADYMISVFARVLSWAKDRSLLHENPLKKPHRVWKGSRARKCGPIVTRENFSPWLAHR